MSNFVACQVNQSCQDAALCQIQKSCKKAAFDSPPGAATTGAAKPIGAAS